MAESRKSLESLLSPHKRGGRSYGRTKNGRRELSSPQQSGGHSYPLPNSDCRSTFSPHRRGGRSRPIYLGLSPAITLSPHRGGPAYSRNPDDAIMFSPLRGGRALSVEYTRSPGVLSALRRSIPRFAATTPTTPVLSAFARRSFMVVPRRSPRRVRYLWYTPEVDPRHSTARGTNVGSLRMDAEFNRDLFRVKRPKSRSLRMKRRSITMLRREIHHLLIHSKDLEVRHIFNSVPRYALNALRIKRRSSTVSRNAHSHCQHHSVHRRSIS